MVADHPGRVRSTRRWPHNRPEKALQPTDAESDTHPHLTLPLKETVLSTNNELHQRRQQAVPRGVTNSLAVYAERAANAELWDVEGHRYIDFASGISVLNTGHVHPKVRAAIAAQLEKLTHTCFQVTPYESYIALAEKLNALAPGAGPKKTLFTFTPSALASTGSTYTSPVKVAVRCSDGTAPRYPLAISIVHPPVRPEPSSCRRTPPATSPSASTTLLLIWSR